jgi:hypothetical protein
MGRILDDEPCVLKLNDRISNSKLTLEYRTPTTAERIAYSNALVTRRGNKVEYNHTATRVKYGLLILTGFADGDFYKSKKKPLSWKPDSPDYDKEWKKIIKEKAADIMEMLAIHVFEMSVVQEAPDTAENEEVEEKKEKDVQGEGEGEGEERKDPT